MQGYGTALNYQWLLERLSMTYNGLPLMVLLSLLLPMPTENIIHDIPRPSTICCYNSLFERQLLFVATIVYSRDN